MRLLAVLLTSLMFWGAAQADQTFERPITEILGVPAEFAEITGQDLRAQIEAISLAMNDEQKQDCYFHRDKYLDMSVRLNFNNTDYEDDNYTYFISTKDPLTFAAARKYRAQHLPSGTSHRWFHSVVFFEADASNEKIQTVSYKTIVELDPYRINKTKNLRTHDIITAYPTQKVSEGLCSTSEYKSKGN